ncbi:MAG: adenosylmethionine--8-amino-7-oxononanoate transaminase [Akkermansiaceae bacterium]
MKDQTRDWIALDRAHAWHPFTDQGEWESVVPLVLVKGEGVWLFDSEGKRYLDANSSIWTNIHGHSHPDIVAAIQNQASELSHSSYLGFANAPASELAGKLCAFFPDELTRCFFSDDGSTALEVALKMSLQFSQQNGGAERFGIIAFEKAYHGDTLGASSVGGVSRFVKGYGEAGLEVYRVSGMEDLKNLPEVVVRAASAVVIEPLIQGVNQMTPWPSGMLAELRSWTSERGIHLILDEVMTGFGRTGKMFACQKEEVIPDFLCLAKGLTGGTMPLAATLTREEIYEGFKGVENTFYYGHSYTANALGCAAALASLRIFEGNGVLDGVEQKGLKIEAALSKIAGVHEVRRVGLVLGFDVAEGKGKVVCERLKREGVLTRPILDTIVIMPPLAINDDEIDFLVRACEKVFEQPLKKP